MRVLVTGADGFAGQWLCAHLIDEGDEVWMATGRAREGSREPTLVADLRDAAAADRICQWAKPEAIYHMAAVAFGPDAERHPGRALETTVGGTMNVLAAASRLSSSPVVLVPSSAEVYGTPRASSPLSEAEPVNPANAYGCTKAAQEMVARAYHEAGILPIVTARAFNHIGPGQRPEFVVASFARQLSVPRSDARAVELRVGNLSSERDFTDVRDVVAAYRLLVVGGHTGRPFNVATGVAVSIRSILDKLVQLSGRSVRIKLDPSRVRRVDPARIVGDASLLRKSTGWEPRRTLQRTLEDIWEDAERRQGRT